MGSGNEFCERGSKCALPIFVCERGPNCALPIFQSFSSSSSSRQTSHLVPFVNPGGRGGGGGGGGGVGESSGGTEVIEKEHMFDKVMTPSDAGKLNRLVIPKQQAEKYFPLLSSSNEKGMMLNFEDRNGKPWTFRYSYWKSSQSYVITRGWSSFVKEKKLVSGDVVSFQRGVGDDLAKDRLFIDWRRCHPQPPPIPAFSLSSPFSLPPFNHHQYKSHHFNNYTHDNSYNVNVYGPMGGLYGAIGGEGGVVTPQQHVGMMQLQRGGVEEMAIPIPSPPQSMVYESAPVVHGKAVAKELRLFGVNMECPIMNNNEHEILSSTRLPYLSTITPPHPPNSSNPTLTLRPYFIHQTYPERVLQENRNDDKGKLSMSLDFHI